MLKTNCIYVEGSADKSISHRAVIFSSLAKGESIISNILLSQDIICSINAFKKLGVSFIVEGATLHVKSHGIKNLTLQNQDNIFDMGNSGTSCRLISGLLCGIVSNTAYTIVGDCSLSTRPMNRIIKPLLQMGGIISSKDNNLLPLFIKGNNPLKGIKYDLDIPSAQIKSSILLAGLFSHQEVIVKEKIATRNHTENMMQYLGVNLKVNESEIILKDYMPSFNGFNYFVPNDFSSSAFFICWALFQNQGKYVFKDISVNPLRTGMLSVLLQMGAKIELKNQRLIAQEHIADIYVYPSKLTGICVSAELSSSMIDEFPILFVLACLIKGQSEFSNLQELKHKESNRLQVMVDNLKKLGANIVVQDDKIIIEPKLHNNNVIINTHGDHRIAMSFIILRACTNFDFKVDDTSCINTSFPKFFNICNKLNIKI